MDIKEYNSLQAEGTALEHLITLLPESSVIERAGLVSRKAEIEAKLASQSTIPPENDESTMFVLMDVIPGFNLVQATETCCKWGYCMDKGAYALTETSRNSVIRVVFSFTPRPKPRQDDATWLKDAQLFSNACDNLYLRSRATDSCEFWRFFGACTKAGYDPNKDGDLFLWLFDRIGCLLSGAPIPSTYRLSLEAVTNSNGENFIRIEKWGQEYNIPEIAISTTTWPFGGKNWIIGIAPEALKRNLAAELLKEER
jgi:hypothetical protein